MSICQPTYRFPAIGNPISRGGNSEFRYISILQFCQTNISFSHGKPYRPALHTTFKSGLSTVTYDALKYLPVALFQSHVFYIINRRQLLLHVVQIRQIKTWNTLYGNWRAWLSIWYSVRHLVLLLCWLQIWLLVPWSPFTGTIICAVK